MSRISYAQTILASDRITKILKCVDIKRERELAENMSDDIHFKETIKSMGDREIIEFLLLNGFTFGINYKPGEQGR